jgi:hypothetical protein
LERSGNLAQRGCRVLQSEQVYPYSAFESGRHLAGEENGAAARMQAQYCFQKFIVSACYNIKGAIHLNRPEQGLEKRSMAQQSPCFMSVFLKSRY